MTSDIFNSKQDFIEQYRAACVAELGRDFEFCTSLERYQLLAGLLAEKSSIIRNKLKKSNLKQKKKEIYYFSMEFLIGRLLDNYLLNFGIRDLVAEGLAELGTDLVTLEAEERDPGLGNGGLGRLAACYVDSLASLGYAGNGNGIRYRYGLFRQEIVGGRQIELPDNWLESGCPWETRKAKYDVIVRFGGEVVRHEEKGKFWFSVEGGDKVRAVPYDIPIVGFGGKTVNPLRLWSAEPCDECFDMEAFNRGDYSGAVKYRSDIEAITYILYPSDSGDPGRILRLKQEYLFVAAGLANILTVYKENYGSDWKNFPDRVAIQINDTHPSLCAPELLRLLIDEESLDWDAAWDVVIRTMSFTNHTVLPEASEKWPIEMFRSLLPRVYMFIEEIDRRYRESFPRKNENWVEQLRKTAIIWDGQVHMANLSIIAAHSVNGVAELHTEILKTITLKEFYQLTPEKFSNKTNGISHRRFLAGANKPLSSLITSAIGNRWLSDASALGELNRFTSDSAFKAGFETAKHQNKIALADYIRQTSGVIIDPNSIFDVQVKRIHAYKRQLMNIFKIMHLYSRLRSDSTYVMQPTSFIFSGKAAQSYDFAKDTIRLINSVAEVVNKDTRTNDRLKVAFVPNFSVSSGEIIYPAADISEQISTAGMEASGTGNMKFMMNGAITLGTLDGANVEIRNEVGKDNIRIFGMNAEQVDALRHGGSHFAWDDYHNDPDIKAVVDQLTDGSFAGLSGGFESIYDALLRHNDDYFVLRDLKPYIAAWEDLTSLYADRDAWNRIAIANTAQSGYFSSDRSITEYAAEIWHIT